MFFVEFLGFRITEKDLEDDEKAVQVYHKIVESFKWSYARRALLGDPEFLPKANITKVITIFLLPFKCQSQSFAVGDVGVVARHSRKHSRGGTDNLLGRC